MTAPTYATTLQAMQMLRILEGRATRAMPISEMAERLEVHPRTVKRYIDALGGEIDGDGGAPIVSRERRGGVPFAVLATRESAVAANVFQYAAVHAAAQHLAVTNDPVLAESAAMVTQKLRSSLGPQVAELAERVSEAFVYVPFGPKDYAGDEAVLDTIVRAALRRHPVGVTYASMGGSTYETVIHPYAVVMYRDGLYVLCGEVQRRGCPTRVYSVDRLLSAAADTGSRFVLPRGFSARKYFEGQLGIWRSDEAAARLRIAFREGAAVAAAERRWPGFVSWTNEGGRRVLELEIPVTPQVVTWILTWGAQAEVLEPPALRAQVARTLREAAGLYAD